MYKEIDPLIKNAWIEALRSKKYEQGFYSLKEQNQYCALGVLAELNPVLISLMPIWHIVGTENLKAVIILNDEERKTFDEIADFIEINM